MDTSKSIFLDYNKESENCNIVHRKGNLQNIYQFKTRDILWR